MTVDQAMDVVRQALMVTLTVAAPILAAGLVIGLIVSILQAVTQVQEQTLSFVPKIFGMAVVAILIVPWAYVQIAEFATRMFGAS